MPPKNITMQVPGQNAGINAYNAGFDQNNPLTAGPAPALGAYPPGSTAMVPYQPQQQSYVANIFGVNVAFASEADFLRAQNAFNAHFQQPGGVPSLGGSDASSWLRTGADAVDAVSSYLRGRALHNQLNELNASLNDQQTAYDNLHALSAKYPDLIPPLLSALRAERDATNTSAQIIEDEISAVDIEAGAGLARVVSNFMGGGNQRGTFGGSCTGTAMAVGAAGLGIGMLLSSRNNTTRSR